MNIWDGFSVFTVILIKLRIRNFVEHIDKGCRWQTDLWLCREEGKIGKEMNFICVVNPGK